MKTVDIQIKQCSFACQGAADKEYLRLPEFPGKEERVTTRNCRKCEAQNANKSTGCTMLQELKTAEKPTVSQNHSCHHCAYKQATSKDS